MASQLRYDTEKMRNSARKYESIANEMISVKNEINTQVKSLISNDWLSNAGIAFSEMYSSDWGNNVDKYVAVLQEFATMLRNAAKKYDEVTKLAERIRI